MDIPYFIAAGEVFAWGDNRYAQLAQGTRQRLGIISQPVRVGLYRNPDRADLEELAELPSPNLKAIDIVAGSYHCLALIGPIFLPSSLTFSS